MMLRGWYPFLHPLNLEDITSVIERPKIDCEDSYLFAILQLPRWDERLRLTRPYEVDIFVGHGFIITAQDGKLKPLQRLFDHAEADDEARAALLGKGGGHTFYVIIDVIIDYIFPILTKIDRNIRILEERIFADDGRVIIREIAVLRRDIIAMQRIIRQLVPVIETLNDNTRRVFRDDMTDYFDDIVDHIHRARDMIDEDADIIAALADTADKLLTHRLNNVIRVLTVISVIMLPLTLLTGMFGMNFEFIPLEQEPLAFAIISGIMVAIAVSMLAFFRIRQWL